jgi:hypothetical protein
VGGSAEPATQVRKLAPALAGAGTGASTSRAEIAGQWAVRARRLLSLGRSFVTEIYLCDACFCGEK